MKSIRILLIIVSVASLLACGTSKFSKNGTKEKEFITKLCGYMDHEKGPMYKELMNCISPEYIKTNGLDISNYKVNNYGVYGSSIESFIAKTGVMKVKIWGENRSWVHLLEFKLVKESGKLYVIPGRHSESYIDPWYSVESYIKE